MKFRKKPVVIEAIQLTWQNWNAVCDFMDNKEGFRGVNLDKLGEVVAGHTEMLGALIPTLEGTMLAREGDWIIKGIKGEFYPCKPDIFAETYEEVS